ncbi:MAG TPA: ABC transporter permease [Bryobacteraceae bacterium]|nr:ABC transporter permease [Bryobacteraceae bacterium]
MNGLAEQFVISLRLYFRNKMGMFYGYLFPAIFLLAFWVLYRSEPVPISRHLGQLLTVTILGGACLGMPTVIVSERERGVWRRYRMTPASTRALIASSVLVRFLILITAGLLQIALAMAIGMPLPKHPLDLGIAFTVVSFAFLGLGLVIAAMADNVPSVQALGQCIFLPMLIVGGVAVPVETLPGWAQHIASFFPGRYAVASLQACVNGVGIGKSGFDFLALFFIGATGLLAGGRMFRWEAGQRFSTRRKGWLTPVAAAWAVIGIFAEAHGSAVAKPAPAPAPSPALAPTVAAVPQTPPPTPPASHQPETASYPLEKPAPIPHAKTWKEVTLAEIDATVHWGDLPADTSFYAPVSLPGMPPPDDLKDQIEQLRSNLPDWPLGHVADPVQRVRNFLYIPAVTDVLRTEILEGYVPLVVFDELKKDIPKDDLIKLLYWVASHPAEGDDTAASRLDQLGLENAPPDMDTVRERVSTYALKLLGRLIGKIH